MCMLAAHKDQKKALDLLELELQTEVSHHDVGAENWTQDL